MDELLIKQWESLEIPWEADNGGSAMFLWYPEQQALGNQVQLNSQPHTHTYAHTHKPFFDTHLAREAPVLIKGSVLDACFC